LQNGWKPTSLYGARGYRKRYQARIDSGSCGSLNFFQPVILLFQISDPDGEVGICATGNIAPELGDSGRANLIINGDLSPEAVRFLNPFEKDDTLIDFSPIQETRADST
jgi:hypothetical protein